jgi:hypothetical protein
MDENDQADFEQAMGEEFSEFVSPPVSREDGSPHECCEAIWKVLGRKVTPSTLDSLQYAQMVALSESFGRYFETDAPSVERIKDAIAGTLARWPVGSLGEKRETHES